MINWIKSFLSMTKKAWGEFIFQQSMEKQLNTAIDYYWRKSRRYKNQIAIDNFADLYMLIKDIPREDVRKLYLSQRYGIDVFSIYLGKTFEETINYNIHWIEFIDDIDKGYFKVTDCSAYFMV